MYCAYVRTPGPSGFQCQSMFGPLELLTPSATLAEVASIKPGVVAKPFLYHAGSLLSPSSPRTAYCCYRLGSPPSRDQYFKIRQGTPPAEAQASVQSVSCRKRVFQSRRGLCFSQVSHLDPPNSGPTDETIQHSRRKLSCGPHRQLFPDLWILLRCHKRSCRL